jgi:hypothetical protein
LAERKVGSCERPPDIRDEDGYEILHSKNIQNKNRSIEECEVDPISIFMKTAMSPDVQNIKRRLIEQNRSR